MINSIRMTNFRKHTDTKLQFGPGFTVIRGRNEQGKSTAYEAIAYALFGVGALRTPLSKAVTWGEPESSLKVVLDLGVDGIGYSVSRSKSGAEVTYPDGIVTGQKEVTNFMGKTLRMDVGAAQRLVLSNQKEIAGALEAGTKATTELIERLAEFNQIDRLLDLMQEKLALGSDATAQAALSMAQERLDAARAVQEPDILGLATDMDLRGGEVEVAQAAVATARVGYDQAQAAHTRGLANASEHASLAQRRKRLRERHTTATGVLSALRAAPVHGPDNVDAQTDALSALKGEIARKEVIKKAWDGVSTLCGRVAVHYFQGSAESLQAGLDVIRSDRKFASSVVGALEVRLAVLESSKNSGSCGFCGQDFSAVPEVKSKNDALAAEALVLTDQRAQALAAIESCDRGEAEMLKILADGRVYVAAAQRYAEFLQVDTSVYPPILGWNSVTYGSGSADLTAPQIDAQIRDLRMAERNARAWGLAVSAEETTLANLSSERDEITQRSDELGEPVDTTSLANALSAATLTLQGARQALVQATTAHNDAKGTLRDAQREWDRAVADLQAATALVETNRAAITELAFNNTLLKRVRVARPVIADRLWNLVLASVSSYFSEMRGVASVVSKGADGFQIDGEPVESFSGSTIDVLGLAIRVALVRTFLPSAPFLILDEPAAACSAERTDNMLGFIVGSGFKQILLVTHEDVSESIADNIITLGETV